MPKEKLTDCLERTAKMIKGEGGNFEVEKDQDVRAKGIPMFNSITGENCFIFILGTEVVVDDLVEYVKRRTIQSQINNYGTTQN